MNEILSKEAMALPNIKSFIDEEISFIVPSYQRGYRWNKEQVNRLIQDLCEFQKEEDEKEKSKQCPFYSLQVLVVEQKDEKLYEVIDGQQRLTTMLLMNQAFHIVKNIEKSGFRDLIINTEEGLIPSGYDIKYSTRKNSYTWLKELTLAYLHDQKEGTRTHINEFKSKCRDYYHFEEVLSVCITALKDEKVICKLNDWETLFKERAKFIWYDKSKVSFEDSNEMIFNRLNATKIKLNNAELIKALFLQKGVYSNDRIVNRDQLAIDWDLLEKRLQDPEFWMFICRSEKVTAYDTHIEYLFDILSGKSSNDKDRENFTFDYYYDMYLVAHDKFEFVKEQWKIINELFQILEEWYNNRHFYHLTGYLLEYGMKDNKPMTIPDLVSLLYEDPEKKKMMPKSKWLYKLTQLVKDSLSTLSSTQLVFANKDIMIKVLMLFNVIQEDNRSNPNARFSFNEFKRIKLGLHEGMVWHLEHVASNSDYVPDLDKRQQLGRDLMEYFTGIDISLKEIESDEELTFKDKYTEGIKSLDEEEKGLCKSLLKLFDRLPEEQVAKEAKEKELQNVFAMIQKHFDADDPLREEVLDGNRTRNEKDFIWNFVLLNSRTNMSYGNSIFPIKRKRIIRDEDTVFTPIGTRNVFDKAYSHKLSNLITWGRKDAKDYWDEINRTLMKFLPDNFKLPQYIKL